jgi:hypothetical protein
MTPAWLLGTMLALGALAPNAGGGLPGARAVTWTEAKRLRLE